MEPIYLPTLQPDIFFGLNYFFGNVEITGIPTSADLRNIIFKDYYFLQKFSRIQTKKRKVGTKYSFPFLLNLIIITGWSSGRLLSKKTGCQSLKSSE